MTKKEKRFSLFFFIKMFLFSASTESPIRRRSDALFFLLNSLKHCSTHDEIHLRRKRDQFYLRSTETNESCSTELSSVEPTNSEDFLKLKQTFLVGFVRLERNKKINKFSCLCVQVKLDMFQMSASSQRFSASKIVSLRSISPFHPSVMNF